MQRVIDAAAATDGDEEKRLGIWWRSQSNGGPGSVLEAGEEEWVEKGEEEKKCPCHMSIGSNKQTQPS